MIDVSGDEDLSSEDNSNSNSDGGAPAWLRTLSGFLESWQASLPASFEVPELPPDPTMTVTLMLTLVLILGAQA